MLDERAQALLAVLTRGLGAGGGQGFLLFMQRGHILVDAHHPASLPGRILLNDGGGMNPAAGTVRPHDSEAMLETGPMADRLLQQGFRLLYIFRMDAGTPGLVVQALLALLGADAVEFALVFVPGDGAIPEVPVPDSDTGGGIDEIEPMQGSRVRPPQGQVFGNVLDHAQMPWAFLRAGAHGRDGHADPSLRPIGPQEAPVLPEAADPAGIEPRHVIHALPGVFGRGDVFPVDAFQLGAGAA